MPSPFKKSAIVSTKTRLSLLRSHPLPIKTGIHPTSIIIQINPHCLSFLNALLPLLTLLTFLPLFHAFKPKPSLRHLRLFLNMSHGCLIPYLLKPVSTLHQSLLQINPRCLSFLNALLPLLALLTFLPLFMIFDPITLPRHLRHDVEKRGFFSRMKNSRRPRKPHIIGSRKTMDGEGPLNTLDE